MARKSRSLRLLSKASVGVFHSKEWMKSGYSLLASSRTLRATWTNNKRILIRHLESYGESDLNEIKLFERDKQLLGPSLLLLGYAAEMFLKAGLAQVLHGCSEQLFKTLTSKEYGHNLQRIAQSIYFDLDKSKTADLNTLQKLLESEGRYPLEADSEIDLILKSNELRHRTSSTANYRRLCKLVKQLALHSQELRGTTKSPVSTGSWQFHEDGYISLWWKQGLPPRITYRLSPELEREEDPLGALRAMVKSVPKLDTLWSQSELYEEEVEVKVQLRRRKPLE